MDVIFALFTRVVFLGYQRETEDFVESKIEKTSLHFLLDNS